MVLISYCDFFICKIICKALNYLNTMFKDTILLLFIKFFMFFNYLSPNHFIQPYIIVFYWFMLLHRNIVCGIIFFIIFKLFLASAVSSITSFFPPYFFVPPFLSVHESEIFVPEWIKINISENIPYGPYKKKSDVHEKVKSHECKECSFLYRRTVWAN